MTVRPDSALRRISLAALLVSQAAQLWLFFPNEPRVLSDNTHYEEAGYNLANGRGLSLSFSTLADEDVRSWGCTRHPERCSEGDLYPTACYPPGYQYYVALVYYFAGRSLTILLITQCLLHLLLMLMFENVALRQLGKAGYLFAVGVAVTYPFLARQAGFVMSDHLHAVLLFASVWAFFTLEREGLRAAASGLLFSLATLTRPYSVLAIPALLLIPNVRRTIAPSGRALALLLAGLTLPFGLWTARNVETFGRLIPFSTMGLGHSLYMNKTEWTIGSTIDEESRARVRADLHAVFPGDPAVYRGSQKLQKAALEWMAENPHLVLAALPKRIVRVWVSMGFEGQGVHPLMVGLVVYLGALLLLGVVGMWQRKQGRWLFPLVVVLSYWAFLMHTPGEARRTLPLRLPMLLFAGAAVDDFAAWRRRKRGVLADPGDDAVRPTADGENAPNPLAHQRS